MDEKPVVHETLSLSVEQAAALIPCSVSTAYQLVRRKDFPSFKLVKSWRVSRKGLEKWIEEQAGYIC